MMNNVIKLVTVSIVTFLAAYIGQIFTTPAIPTWYATLNKPFFNPPNWLFAPAWTLLYILMAVAAYLVWREEGKNSEVRPALLIFIVQLALNSLWSIAFFGLRSPLLGLIVIVLLWVAILFTILKFLKVSKPAGWLLVPYILWVSFAMVLNFSVFILNL